jgi:hypothetical protein
LQLVVTVDKDGQRAHGRSRALIQGAPGGGPGMMWAEGVYENTYVLQNGAWKIQHMFWAATFYGSVSGIDSLRFSGAPASTSTPPDEPARQPDTVVGRTLVPFQL